MVKAEVIKLYSHVKYNLLYIFTFLHVKIYIFSNIYYIQKIFPLHYITIYIININ